MEELNCETAFTIPVFGGIPVAESVVVTWIIMAVLLLGSIILVRNLKVENVGKKQVVLETVVGGLYNFFYDLLGEDGKGYIPYLMTVGLYIGVANMIGLFGLKSPTKDVGVTGALALMSIVLIEFSGVHKKGVKGFLKSFAEPIPLMLPMNILEISQQPPVQLVVCYKPSKGLCYCSPQRAVSQAFLLVRYKAVLLESSFLDSSACSFIYFCTASSVILPIVST